MTLFYSFVKWQRDIKLEGAQMLSKERHIVDRRKALFCMGLKTWVSRALTAMILQEASPKSLWQESEVRLTTYWKVKCLQNHQPVAVLYWHWLCRTSTPLDVVFGHISFASVQVRWWPPDALSKLWNRTDTSLSCTRIYQNQSQTLALVCQLQRRLLPESTKKLGEQGAWTSLKWSDVARIACPITDGSILDKFDDPLRSPGSGGLSHQLSNVEFNCYAYPKIFSAANLQANIDSSDQKFSSSFNTRFCFCLWSLYLHGDGRRRLSCDSGELGDSRQCIDTI